MVDHLKKRLDRLKIMAESAKRRTELYSDLAKLDDKNTTRSLSALNKAPNPGILAGRYLDKIYNGSKLMDVGNHTKDTVSTIHDFKRSVT